MALVRPMAQTKNAFDASNDETFYFTSNGGDQVVKNKIVIRKQSDNSIVYQNTVDTYKFEQTIPKNTLVNGEYYNYYFVTYDIHGNSSDNSNIVSFYCYTTPIISFTNLIDGGVVGTASFTFNFTYKQKEGELLDFCVVKLYDANNNNIKTSDNIYYKGENTFSYEVSGLEDNKSYKIEILGTTVNHTNFESGLINFIVSYTTPILYSKLNLTNECNDGYVQIVSNLVIAEGMSNPVPPRYIDDNTKVSILYYDEYVEWTQGYDITKDFILEIWGSPSKIDEFCRLWNNKNDTIKLKFIREIPFDEQEVKDYFTVSAIVNDTEQIFARSNYVPIMNNTTQYVVWVKKVKNTWELILEILSQQDNVFVWNDTEDKNNVEYNRTTSLSWNGEAYNKGIEIPQKFNYIDDMFPIYNSKLKNGNYDHFNITSETSKLYTTEKPQQWNYYTLLDCDFNGNINGGNVNILLSKLDSVRIKRRDKGTFDWILLKEIQATNIDDINFVFNDYLIPSNSTQEYAIVPVMNGGIEGDYIISEIDTKFNGVFVSSNDKTFKLYSGVAYGDIANNKLIGALQPINSKYPTIVQNSKTQYYSGSVSGALYGYNFEDTRVIDRYSVLVQIEDFVDTLSQGDAICIKDWNGSIWIGRVSSNESISYDVSKGYGSIAFTFVEQGKYNNQDDLYENGFVY